MATIRIQFEGLKGSYTARKWRIPTIDYDSDDAPPFEPIPADSTSLLVTSNKSLYLNRRGDGRPCPVSLENARKWGFNDKESTKLIYARAKSSTKRFCLRFVFNAQQSTCDRRTNTFRAYHRLVKDAKFHATHLIPIEGLLVPFHYGMWLMDTGEWAGKVLFSITQWCGMPWSELSHTKLNTEANRYAFPSSSSLKLAQLVSVYRVLVGRAFEALHDHGVDHGGLRHLHDFRHVIIDVHAPNLSRADLLDGKAPCYIVGFSEALADHECARKLPLVPLSAYVEEEEVGCAEIADVILLLDFINKSYNTTPPSEALPGLPSTPNSIPT
ncbi:hypothetical protein C8R44DRAFT_10072 [Mycena epipterygia]|nr:hypothetical protein C8R44DRAFT_10072 [Mycena epipterygia]